MALNLKTGTFPIRAHAHKSRFNGRTAKSTLSDEYLRRQRSNETATFYAGEDCLSNIILYYCTVTRVRDLNCQLKVVCINISHPSFKNNFFFRLLLCWSNRSGNDTCWNNTYRLNTYKLSLLICF